MHRLSTRRMPVADTKRRHKYPDPPEEREDMFEGGLEGLGMTSEDRNFLLMAGGLLLFGTIWVFKSFLRWRAHRKERREDKQMLQDQHVAICDLMENHQSEMTKQVELVHSDVHALRQHFELVERKNETAIDSLKHQIAAQNQKLEALRTEQNVVHRLSRLLTTGTVAEKLAALPEADRQSLIDNYVAEDVSPVVEETISGGEVYEDAPTERFESVETEELEIPELVEEEEAKAETELDESFAPSAYTQRVHDAALDATIQFVSDCDETPGYIMGLKLKHWKTVDFLYMDDDTTIGTDTEGGFNADNQFDVDVTTEIYNRMCMGAYGLTDEFPVMQEGHLPGALRIAMEEASIL